MKEKDQLEEYFDRLWPINRSLSGNGNRESFRILSELVDLDIREIPSGTKCFDWEIPAEWNAKEAWIKNSKGEKIVDFNRNNLHLLGYSEPVKGSFSYDELKEHIYTLSEQPDVVPYVTSYYKRRWGFCMSHDSFVELDKNETYKVFIDSSLDEKGSMTIGEAVIEGSSEKEILFSTYVCHPSMANNELSGPLVTAFLYNRIKKIKNPKYTYRFVFVPETIGSIYYLSEKGEHFRKNLEGGFILTCIGDDGAFTYKKSRKGDALPDKVAKMILEQTEQKFNLMDFFPSGSDERQYCSPGFDLPIGVMMRTMYGTYPEYHTSADDKNFISFEAMEESVEKLYQFVEILELNQVYWNTLPYCEPQLGKRGLFPTLGTKNPGEFIKTMMWILNLSDGFHDLISISEKSGLPFSQLIPVLKKLKENGILSLNREDVIKPANDQAEAIESNH